MGKQRTEHSSNQLENSFKKTKETKYYYGIEKDKGNGRSWRGWKLGRVGDRDEDKDVK